MGESFTITGSDLGQPMTTGKVAFYLDTDNLLHPIILCWFSHQNI